MIRFLKAAGALICLARLFGVFPGPIVGAALDSVDIATVSLPQDINSMVVDGDRSLIVTATVPVKEAVIPNFVSGPVRTVGLGETLVTIAAQTGFSTRELAVRNRLTSGFNLRVGQRIVLPALPLEKIKLHRVTESDTLLSVAVQYNVSPVVLQRANLLICNDCITPGQILRVPGDVAGGQLPAPFVDIQVSPQVPSAGDVIEFKVLTSTHPKTLVGDFGGRPLHFAQVGNSYIALIGLSPAQKADLIQVSIHLTDENDQVSDASSLIQLGASGYGVANVTLSNNLAFLLKPEVNDLEALALANIYGEWSERQRWSGIFKLPTNDEITDYYGALRWYNGGIYKSYHSGIDVRAWKGTLSRAAAPGRVAAVRSFAIRGLTVIVDHGRGVFTAYCHNSEILVKEGDLVGTGDVLARSGTTGRSEGPHIHFELAVGGAQVDPVPWFSQTLP